MRKLTRLASVLLIAAALSLSGAKAATATCLTFATSGYQYIDGSAYCAGTGGGCSVCVRFHDTSSWSVCYNNLQNGDYDCTFYN